MKMTEKENFCREDLQHKNVRYKNSGDEHLRSYMRYLLTNTMQWHKQGQSQSYCVRCNSLLLVVGSSYYATISWHPFTSPGMRKSQLLSLIITFRRIQNLFFAGEKHSSLQLLCTSCIRIILVCSRTALFCVELFFVKFPFITWLLVLKPV